MVPGRSGACTCVFAAALAVVVVAFAVPTDVGTVPECVGAAVEDTIGANVLGCLLSPSPSHNPTRPPTRPPTKGPMMPSFSGFVTGGLVNSGACAGGAVRDVLLEVLFATSFWACW